ncbi:MAG: hypothetical protein LBC55_06450 [Desulfovibrio sp.]|jgi:hypothetical protein|nr:hypothetical protein [Desulfovibrio sp.]
MNIKDTTLIHVFIGLCFIIIPILCMTGYWPPCVYLAALVITLYMLLGSRHNGRVDPVFFCFPLCTFFLLWVVAFICAQRNALPFTYYSPENTLLGFHPSFFWIALLFWFGGLLILSIGIVKFHDRWLPPEAWEAFKKRIAELNDEAAAHDEKLNSEAAAYDAALNGEAVEHHEEDT